MPRRDGKGPRGGDAREPAGNCLCLSCNYRLLHQTGVACTNMVCLQCGKPLVREDLGEK